MDDQPEDDQPDNLTLVQRQFRRQAEAYSTMKVVTDPRILDNIVEISAVRADSRVLDVACGPGFVAMAFAPKCRSVLGIDATDTLDRRLHARVVLQLLPVRAPFSRCRRLHAGREALQRQQRVGPLVLVREALDHEIRGLFRGPDRHERKLKRVERLEAMSTHVAQGLLDRSLIVKLHGRTQFHPFCLHATELTRCTDLA